MKAILKNGKIAYGRAADIFIKIGIAIPITSEPKKVEPKEKTEPKEKVVQKNGSKKVKQKI